MTHIWVPRTKIIEPKEFLPLPVALQGFFKFEAIRPDGRVRLLADWFPNLVLNQGLDLIGAGSSILSAVRVGTGNTAPANGDTNLVSHVAGTGSAVSTNTTAQPSSPYFVSHFKTWQFSQGAAAGNLAEVGVGTSTANASNLFSRALILDGGGSPTTLTVLSDEFLNVSYELRAYPNEVDGAGSLTITGVGSRNYTARAANVTSTSSWSPASASGGTAGSSSNIVSYSGALGAITTVPSGALGAVTGVNDGSYSNGTYQRDFTSTWTLSQGNGTIRSFSALMGFGQMQYELDSTFAKTSSQTLSMTFRHTWARKTLP